MAFVGYPPMEGFRPEADEVHISVAFTWDIERGKELQKAWGQYYDWDKVYLGGPAFGVPGAWDGFELGCYIKHGVTFSTRGCNNNCPPCLVPEREGKLRTLPIIPGWILQDNNILQAPRSHRDAVFQMLRSQRRAVSLSGGLQASLVTDEIAEQIRGLKIHEVYLAADSDGALKPLERAVRKLSFLPQRKLRCYVLLAFGGETIEQARARLERVWEIGCLPFAQLYQPPDKWIKYSQEWKDLRREWERPAAMFAMHKEG